MSHVKKRRDILEHTTGSARSFLEQLRENGLPVRLSINGQKELLVQDAGSYQLLMELVERLETIDGVKASMEAFERGEGQPAPEALEKLCQKHCMPS